MCVFLGHNVNLMLPCWDGEQLSYVGLINDQMVKNSGVSTYRWTLQGRKLGVSGHRGHQSIDAYGYALKSVYLDESQK